MATLHVLVYRAQAEQLSACQLSVTCLEPTKFSPFFDHEFTLHPNLGSNSKFI